MWGDKGLGGQSETQREQSRRWSKKLCHFREKNPSKTSKKEEYEKARKENLCFNYFEAGHSKVACPKLVARGSSNATKKDIQSPW